MPDPEELAWFKRGTALLEPTLRQIGDGIGAAAAAVLAKSRSDIGTLAVKSAEVTVDLEVTASAEKNGIGVAPGDVAVRSFRLEADEHSARLANRVSIKLHIVAVADAPPPWPALRWNDRKLLEGFIAAADALQVSALRESDLSARVGIPAHFDRGTLAPGLAPALGDPAPGDPKLLQPLARLVAQLLAAVADLPDDERDRNRSGAEAIHALVNLASLLTDDTSHDAARRNVIIALAANLAAYWKGLLSARSSWA